MILVNDRSLKQVFMLVLIAMNIVIFTLVISQAPAATQYTGQAVNISAGESYVWRNITVDSVNGGATLTVHLELIVNSINEDYYIIEEVIPENFTVVDAGGGSSSTPGRIKWARINGINGVGTNATTSTITYTLTAPNNYNHVALFEEGIFIFTTTPSGVPEYIIGDTNVSVVYQAGDPGDDGDPGDSSPLLLKGDSSPLLLKGSPLLIKGGLPPPPKEWDVYTTDYDFAEELYRAVLTYNYTEEMTVSIERFDGSDIAEEKRFYYGGYAIEGAADAEVIEGTLYIKVAKSWITENDINPNAIGVYLDDEGSWLPLETSKFSEDDTHSKYRASSTSLGSFAIAGDQYGYQQGSTEDDINVQVDDQNPLSDFDDQTVEEVFEEDDPGGFKFLAALLGLMIVVTALVILFYNHAHHKLQGEGQQATNENIAQMQSYVMKARAKGKSDAQIVQALKNVGWKQQDIDKAMAS